MASRNLDSIRSLVRWRSSRAALAAVALLLAVGAVGAVQAGHDPRLSATLVGSLEPGETGRLAVRWDGERGALLDAWVDLDGDGRRTAAELVIDGRPLAGGIEVVDFDVPAEALVASEPRLWAEIRKVQHNPPSSGGEAAGGGSRDACAWQPGFFWPGLDGEVRAVAVFDDGTGPALYVGGFFDVAGGVTVNHIARWDGTAWSALSGPSGTGLNTRVNVLAVFDDGSGPALYAGGEFTSAGGVTVNRVARWDGSAWSALSGPSGTGLSGFVYALTVFDDGSGPALYAGGSFTTAGGVTVNSIARWDGTTWSPLSGPSGTGVSGSVYALAVFDDGTGPALYAGGLFWTAGGVWVYNVARWDGTAWSALSGPSGTGVYSYVYALAVYDDGSGPALYVGGQFLIAGGVTVNHVARWDGTAWSALSVGVGDDYNVVVRALAVFDDGSGPALFAGGDFTTAGGVTVNCIARWDGTSWSALSGPSGTGVDGTVWALAVFDDGTGPALYAGGSFNAASGVGAPYIARWNGSAWSALSGPSGTGMDNSVEALTVFDDGTGPALYVGGYFTAAGGVTVNHVARWDGTAWSALSGPSGTGVNGGVYALAVFDDGSGPALYAGGDFLTAGGVGVYRVARWNGTVWSALSGPSGTGLSSGVSALAVFDDGTGPALYAGGSFTTAGGVTVNHIARWNGTAWSPLSGPSGTGLDSNVLALAAFDDGPGPALYAGGDFHTAGGVTVNHVARWDGTAWSALSGPSATGVNDRVYALAIFDDGSGPALYAGGRLTFAGGLDAGYIARWDGTAWSPVKAVNLDIFALTVFDDDSENALYAGGWFTTAGGVTVGHIARWDGVHWSALSGPSGTGVNSNVYALAVFDDGSGPEVYAGGGFTIAGGLLSSRIAAWRGPCSAIFADGFETGDTSAWAATVP